MALITSRVSGFYVDGTCEVSVVYNDVTNILQEILVEGVIDREVDVTVNGETAAIARSNGQQLRFNLVSRNITYFVALDDAPNDIPSIVCTYYAKHLSREDIIAGRVR